MREIKGFASWLGDAKTDGWVLESCGSANDRANRGRIMDINGEKENRYRTGKGIKGREKAILNMASSARAGYSLARHASLRQACLWTF